MSHDTSGIAVTRKVGYTVIPNDRLPVGDDKISARSWGVYAYLLGRPPGWEARVSHLRTVFTEGRDALYTAMGELVEAGLMKKETRIDGGLRRDRFVLDEEAVIERFRRSAPDTGSQDPDSQDPGNPDTDSPDPGRPDPEKPEEVSKEGTTKEGTTTEKATTEGVTSAAADAPPKKDLNEGREDVDRLCAHLSQRLTELGVNHNPATKVWRDAARLMIDADGRTEAQIHTCIEWALTNAFWHRNIHSMPTLREKYDRLRLDAQSERASGGRTINNRHQAPPEQQREHLAAFNG